MTRRPPLAELLSLEDSVTGTTVNAYASALDLDTRGVKNMTFVVENTDGANSLDWQAIGEYADYDAGTDEEIRAEETRAPGEKGLLQLEHAYSRVKIQVKSTVGGDHATYSIRYLLNR